MTTENTNGLLRFITAGSVDDGKSTLIGRLLFDSKAVLSDQLLAVRNAKHKRTIGEQIDFSLLTDGLEAEREQGITIDVAYRYFSTAKRKFIIADTPGHEQYTRNMVTGASTADAAVVLIDPVRALDAQDNVSLLAQTRRHSALLRLLGIRHIVVAVNKMDLIGFDQQRFEKICDAYAQLATQLGLTDVRYIPVSALGGDNVVTRSENMPWYQGQPLLSILESLELAQPGENDPAALRFPVQLVYARMVTRQTIFVAIWAKLPVDNSLSARHSGCCRAIRRELSRKYWPGRRSIYRGGGRCSDNQSGPGY